MKGAVIKEIPGVIPTTITPEFAGSFVALIDGQATGTIDSQGNPLHKTEAVHPGYPQVGGKPVEVTYYVKA